MIRISSWVLLQTSRLLILSLLLLWLHLGRQPPTERLKGHMRGTLLVLTRNSELELVLFSSKEHSEIRSTILVYR